MDCCFVRSSQAPLGPPTYIRVAPTVIAGGHNILEILAKVKGRGQFAMREDLVFDQRERELIEEEETLVTEAVSAIVRRTQCLPE